MDRGAWWAIAYGFAKSQTQTQMATTTNSQYMFTEEMNKQYSKDKYQMISDCYLITWHLYASYSRDDSES